MQHPPPTGTCYNPSSRSLSTTNCSAPTQNHPSGFPVFVLYCFVRPVPRLPHADRCVRRPPSPSTSRRTSTAPLTPHCCAVLVPRLQPPLSARRALFVTVVFTFLIPAYLNRGQQAAQDVFEMQEYVEREKKKREQKK
eukprot:256096-Chlamydomonas_euryale.AAC.11